MDLGNWRTNSPELSQELKTLNFEVNEFKESLHLQLTASKVLEIDWDEKADTFYLETKNNLEIFLPKRNDIKRYLLQAAGRIFDPMGFICPNTI
ncbi:hypothetical protein NPIL_688861 [Nephila pilipes]|uniref:Uncharacterized protein n=1 Tax=Nephila pilipes TaxID=299642 RepID=A0A8X6N2X8_NEPPI|nr:hypothetical protein NPIL_688861 [Nephila pilipes]